VSKETTRNSSTTEKPLCRSPRRLVDWLNPDGQKKVHSLVDKVYQPKNLRAAWEKVKAKPWQWRRRWAESRSVSSRD